MEAHQRASVSIVGSKHLRSVPAAVRILGTPPQQRNPTDDLMMVWSERELLVKTGGKPRKT
jgi:hypothetical protein